MRSTFMNLKISPPLTVNGMPQLCGFISWLFKINYFNNMSPHYKHIYLCHPPFPPLNVCHLCQMCMKPNLRPAGPISPSPLLPLLWEFTSDGVIIPRSPLSPHPPICWWCWACPAIPSSQSPFCLQYLSETRNFKVQIVLNLKFVFKVMFIY